MHAANNINATCPVNDSYEHSKQELLIMKSWSYMQRIDIVA
jgi:hypothetical protein